MEIGGDTIRPGDVHGCRCDNGRGYGHTVPVRTSSGRDFTDTCHPGIPWPKDGERKDEASIGQIIELGTREHDGCVGMATSSSYRHDARLGRAEAPHDSRPVFDLDDCDVASRMRRLRQRRRDRLRAAIPRAALRLGLRRDSRAVPRRERRGEGRLSRIPKPDFRRLRLARISAYRDSRHRIGRGRGEAARAWGIRPIDAERCGRRLSPYRAYRGNPRMHRETCGNRL